MALVKKKPCGAATAYVSRKQALKKLQLSLKDFRRLCILKGIYPVEPRHKKKANNNNSTNKTYYHLKDVQFLLHEPLIAKFRAFKVFVRRLKKTIGKQDQDASKRLRENIPTFKLDHIVKERYPIFVDALRDLDDAISMCYLFSTFPRSKSVKPELIHLCRRLTMEFLHYVIESRSLRKVFISIKGFYYQAEIMGQLITWIVPHTLGHARPDDVDFKIMVTFTEFYSTMLGFVNYKLFNTLNITYPPKLQGELIENVEEMKDDDDDAAEYIASLNHSLKTSLDNVFEDEVQLDEFHESEEADNIKDAKKAAEKKEKLKKLFENCKIFLNREVPRESLVFIIRCFGGDVSFDKTIFVGSTFEETDELITHQIVDRPMSAKQYLNRFYVQPQWIYDSVNACMLMPVEMYFPGENLPPHLSPFVEEKEGDYIPPEKQALLNMQNGISKGLRTVESESEEEASGAEEESDFEEEDVSEELPREALKSKKDLKMKVVSGVLERTDAVKLAQKQAAEDKRLAIMMMPKKKKHLYNKIVYGEKRKNREALKLKEKREEYERSQKRRKINIHS